MFITSGVTNPNSDGYSTAFPCTPYRLSYSLDEQSESQHTRIALRSETINCEINKNAKFWTVSPMLSPGPPDYITWSFGPDTLNDTSATDSEGGMWLRLEIVDQRGQYATTTPFYAKPQPGGTNNQTTCYELSRTSPLYHLPSDQRESYEGDDTSPEWISCVPEYQLNLNDRDAVNNPAKDRIGSSSSSSDSSSLSPGVWFAAVGVPIIVVGFILGAIFFVWHNRRQRRHKTSSIVAPAVKRALERKTSFSNDNDNNKFNKRDNNDPPQISVPLNTYQSSRENSLDTANQHSPVSTINTNNPFRLSESPIQEEQRENNHRISRVPPPSYTPPNDK